MGQVSDLKSTYAISPVEDDTGLRISRARDRFDPVFLLLYCDNYWPLAFDRMWQQFAARNVLAQVTAYRNRDGFTRDNLRIEADGTVALYDKSRTAPELAGVDIGFIIMRREALDLLPEGANVSFEAHVYPQLVQQHQLTAFETDHRYYSVQHAGTA